jgi:predicted DNA-binding WGR domain protein
VIPVCDGFAAIDSNVSLDAPSDAWQNIAPMSEVCHASGGDVQLVVMERVDRTTDAMRFSVLSIEPTLFKEWSLVREWGRIGAAERRRIELYETERAARVELETWLSRKRRRGYAICQRRVGSASATTAVGGI